MESSESKEARPAETQLLAPDSQSLFPVRRFFPGGSEVKRLPGVREIQVQSLGQEDPLEKEMATHSSTLAWKIPWRENPMEGESLGGRSLVGYSPWGHKELGTTERVHFTSWLPEGAGGGDCVLMVSELVASPVSSLVVG